MAGVTANGVALLVALLCMLVASVRSASNYSASAPAAAPSSNYSTSAAPSSNYSASAAPSSNSGWLPAKATWYGKPNGAGPSNNGALTRDGAANVFAPLSANSVVVIYCDRSIYFQVVLATSRTTTRPRSSP
jgi:hypothetical protein